MLFFRLRLLAAAGLVLLLSALQPALAAPALRYTLAMPAPQTHYFDVEMRLTDFGKAYTDLKMPVWAPGSYLVREFARHVEGFEAKAGSSPLRTEKVSKKIGRASCRERVCSTV